MAPIKGAVDRAGDYTIVIQDNRGSASTSTTPAKVQVTLTVTPR